VSGSTLDPAFKAKWVAALLSGEYQQTSATLRSETGFCCLGVACDVSGAGTWEPIDNGTQHRYNLADDSRVSFVPQALADKIGLRGETQHVLSIMNDSSGASFAEIAQYIQDNL
jgi:hypothetical protein